MASNPALAGFILIDTSVLIANYNPTHERHSPASAFLRHAASQALAGQCDLFIADLAVQEFAHYIVRTGLTDDIAQNVYPSVRHAFDAQKLAGQIKKDSAFDWLRLHKMDPQTVFAHVPKVSHALSILRAIPITVVEPELIGAPGFSLVDRMRDNMMAYGLLAADAYHLAVASAIGAETLASIDRDWLLVDQDFTVVADI